MTILEKRRFSDFKKKYPDARIEIRYPLGIGYFLFAISDSSKKEKEITDDEIIIM